MYLSHFDSEMADRGNVKRLKPKRCVNPYSAASLKAEVQLPSDTESIFLEITLLICLVVL